MSTLTRDIPAVGSSRTRAGLAFAVVSATSFGMSGPLARGLLDAGWTPGAAVTARVLVAAAILVVPAVHELHGRWHLLRTNAALLVCYGVVGVAACQLCYFNAVEHIQVGVALLIEYTSPVAVIGWLWFRHGQRPGRLTALGAGVAGAGLVLVLDLVHGADVGLTGVVWAIGAMLGVAAYFVISADEHNELPPVVLAAGGLVVGGIVLVGAGLAGLAPFHDSGRAVAYPAATMPWWLPVLALGLVTAALAYVTGIAASRRLGSRLASFVAMLEVLAALVFAWLLLDELPHAIQLVGGVLILAGVVVVRAGEPRSS